MAWGLATPSRNRDLTTLLTGDLLGVFLRTSVVCWIGEQPFLRIGEMLLRDLLAGVLLLLRSTEF